MLEISAASLQHVQVPVSARAAGAAVILSSDTVKMAFLATGTSPSSGDWKTAQWDTDATTTPSTYRAQCLVGPGGTIVLAAGDYVVWVQVNHSPELTALAAGPMRVM
jgi:hypothetical protein